MLNAVDVYMKNVAIRIIHIINFFNIKHTTEFLTANEIKLLLFQRKVVLWLGQLNAFPQRLFLAVIFVW